jgi:hypothetical protein
MPSVPFPKRWIYVIYALMLLALGVAIVGLLLTTIGTIQLRSLAIGVRCPPLTGSAAWDFGERFDVAAVATTALALVVAVWAALVVHPEPSGFGALIKLILIEGIVIAVFALFALSMGSAFVGHLLCFTS